MAHKLTNEIQVVVTCILQAKQNKKKKNMMCAGYSGMLFKSLSEIFSQLLDYERKVFIHLLLFQVSVFVIIYLLFRTVACSSQMSRTNDVIH